jgi:citrate lyase subunit beta/citryl-CoA lyase
MDAAGSKIWRMNETRIMRSALYTPGANPAVLHKAVGSAADALIFDLEDAVAPEAKAEARGHVVRALADPNLRGRTVVVRVNGLGTVWVEEDVRAISRAGMVGVLFPKISTELDVRHAEGLLNMYGAPRTTELWCMIETPRAIVNAQALGSLALEKGSRMSTWVLGTNDIVKDLRARHTPKRENLVPMLATALMAARANGLAILDGVHNDVSDKAGFEFTCRQGREMGFDGRTLIHPNQIDACHAVYSPTEAEVADAREVIAAFSTPENIGKGVLKVKGRMVELLHADIARQTLVVADKIARCTTQNPQTT